ncbi:MAG: hypothetical protein AAGA23_05975 [Pseudomonadota bacterium]
MPTFRSLLLVLLVAPAIAFSQTTRTLTVDPVPDDAPDQGCTLREAVDVANAGLLDALGCAASESGSGLPVTYQLTLPAYEYFLTGAADDDENLSGDLDVQVPIVLAGQGAQLTVLNGGQVDRVLDLVVASAAVTAEHLTITGGNAPDGGGVAQSGGTLSLTNVVIEGNQSSGRGGGVFTDNGILTLDQCVIRGNQAQEGGGLMTHNGLDLRRSTVAENTAFDGAGIHIRDGLSTISGSTLEGNVATARGGGVFIQENLGARLAISGSAVVNNEAGTGGGGIYSRGGVRPEVDIANSTIAGNSALRDGGGMASSNTQLTNVTVVNNSAGGAGGGVSGSRFSTVVANSLIAGNLSSSAAPDCSGVIQSGGFNLIGINSGCVSEFPGGNPNPNQDIVGTAAIPLEPLLRPVSGDPAFREPAGNSPAVDRIPETSCRFLARPWNPLYAVGELVATDQRGLARDALCDIGAIESDVLFADGFEIP